jgi:hypothetical protein
METLVLVTFTIMMIGFGVVFKDSIVHANSSV